MPFSGPAAVEMMMHACGQMRRNGRLSRKPYRNYYSPSSEDEETWEVLVSMGLASSCLTDSGRSRVYLVTAAGLAFLWEYCKDRSLMSKHFPSCCKVVPRSGGGSLVYCSRPAVAWYEHNGGVCAFCSKHDYPCGTPLTGATPPKLGA